MAMYESIEDSTRDLVKVLRGDDAAVDGADGKDHKQIGEGDESRARLSSWNDRVESSFGRIVASLAAPATPETTNDDGEGADSEPNSAMKSAASMLRGRLLTHLRSRIPLANSESKEGDRPDVDAPENDESKSDLISSGASSTSTGDEGGTSDRLASDVAAAIVDRGRGVHESSDELISTDNTSCTDAPQNDGAEASKDADGDVDDASSSIVEILRASKNLVRLNNFRSDAMGLVDRARDEDERNPIGPLQSRGMLEVYLALLCKSHLLNDESIPNENTCTSEEQGGDGAPNAGNESCGDRSRNVDEVARFASVVLLHIIRGDGKALSTVVDDLDGIDVFSRELIRPNPVPNLLAVVRIVHYLIGTRPDGLGRIDVTLREASSRSGGEGGSGGGDLASVLVATLAWAIRSEPAFPGSGADRRSELVEEILRVLFAVNVIRSKAGEMESSGEGSSSKVEEVDTLTQLGIVLCDILQLQNADTRAYGCKLAAVDLLMDSPPTYANYLLLNGGIEPLLVVLTLQVNAVVVERRGGGRRDTVLLMPILAVLDKMAKASGAVRKIVKEEVFPNHVELEDFGGGDEKVDDGDGAAGSSIPNDKMGPKDAPRGTLRWKLIQLMTWTTDSRIKRCASELLWTLCDGDASEFVARTGFGNAVHMLGIKGVVTLPDEATA